MFKYTVLLVAATMFAACGSVAQIADPDAGNGGASASSAVSVDSSSASIVSSSAGGSGGSANGCPSGSDTLCAMLYSTQQIPICGYEYSPNMTCSLADPGQSPKVWCCASGTVTTASASSASSSGGCSADTQTDVHNCGECGKDCTILPNPSAMNPTCIDGACSYTCGVFMGCPPHEHMYGCDTNIGKYKCACDQVFGDCDNDASNGCETLLDTVDHCGGCFVKCLIPEMCVPGLPFPTCHL